MKISVHAVSVTHVQNYQRPFLFLKLCSFVVRFDFTLSMYIHVAAMEARKNSIIHAIFVSYRRGCMGMQNRYSLH